MANKLANGPAYGIDSRVYMNYENYVVTANSIVVTYIANNNTELTKQIEYTIGDTVSLAPIQDFKAPLGTKFIGWSYTPRGLTIPASSLEATDNLNLYAKWGSGYGSWVQIFNMNSPVTIKNLGAAYEQQSSATVYKLSSNNNYVIWNSIECDAHEVTKPIVEVEELPAAEADDVIYHLKNASEDTYWHFEYDIIRMNGGLPNKGDGTVWKELVLYGLSSPTLPTNLTEIYYNPTAQHTYLYNYEAKRWEAQNNTLFGMSVPETYQVEVTELREVSVPKTIANQVYRVWDTINGYRHYCWCRMIPQEMDDGIEYPRINETIYWILDSKGNLLVASHPILSEDIVNSGHFESKTLYPLWGGPWKNIRLKVKEVYILDDLAPVNLSHWFDIFENVKNFHGLEKISSVYCSTVTCLFAQEYSVDSITGIENWETGNSTNFSALWENTLRNGSFYTELDLSNWDVSKGTNFSFMFENLPNLQHIYVGDKWRVPSGARAIDMFHNLPKLHNWNGGTGKEHAIIDDGKNGGYLERKWVVTFDPNGGTGTMPKRYVYKKTKEKSNIFTLPVCDILPPDGCEFEGWAYSTISSPITVREIEVDSDITLYPLWRAI